MSLVFLCHLLLIHAYMYVPRCRPYMEYMWVCKWGSFHTHKWLYAIGCLLCIHVSSVEDRVQYGQYIDVTPFLHSA